MEDLNPIRRWFAEWRGRWMNIAGSAILRLGDSSGESRLSIRNSEDQEVFFFKSNGRSSIEPGDGAEGEALLRGGSRSLIGNLAVASGVTVDGVDISAFKDNTEVWQTNHLSASSTPPPDPHTQYTLKQSTNYVPGLSGYKIDSTSGDAEFGNIRARGEFSSAVFKINEINASAGTLGVYYSASTVHETFATPSALAGSVNVKIRNATPSSTTAMFSSGHKLQIRTPTATAWFTIDGAPTTSTGFSTYSLVLESGSTSASVEAGTAIVNWGPSGSGAVTLSADGTVGSSPNLSAMTHSGSPWSATTLIARIGNLSGITDATFGTLTGNGTYISGNAYVAGAINAQSGVISGVLTIPQGGEIRQGSGSLASSPATFTGLRVWSETESGNTMGRIAGYNSGTQQWHAGTDGRLYAGGGNIRLDSSGVIVGPKLFRSDVGIAGAPDAGGSPTTSYLGSQNGYSFTSVSTERFGIYAWNDYSVYPGRRSMEIGAWGLGTDNIASILIKTSDFYLTSDNVTIDKSKLTFNGELNINNVFFVKAAGAVTTTGGVGVAGDFSVGPTTGRTFTVASATGNTVVSGTLGVSGATTLNALSATTGTFSGALSATTGTFTGGLNVGSATGAATGDVVLQSQVVFKTASADGGSWAVIGVDAGAGKNFEVYDSHNSRPMFRVYNNRSFEVYGGFSGTTGTFTGALSATTGTFTGGLNVGTATGAGTGEISTSGNVTIAKAANPTLKLSSTNSGGGSRPIMEWNAQNNPDSFYAVYMADGSPRRLSFIYNQSTEGSGVAIAITAANRLGVNTATPGYTLDVAGDARSTGGLNVGSSTGAAAGEIRASAGAVFASPSQFSGALNAWPSATGSASEAALRLRGVAASGAALDISASGSAGQQGGWIQARNAGDYSLNYLLLLNPNGGNVAVNKTSASYPLDVDGTVNSAGVYRVSGTQVVRARVTGWAGGTGPATRTTFATSTVTTAQLAERVKALIDDLTTHGLIGA